MSLYGSDSGELEVARVQLHQAAQMIAAAGVSYAEHQADDSHTNMELLRPLNVWAGAVCPGKRSWRLALDFSALKYLFLDGEEHTPLSEYALHGQTIDEARAWFMRQVIRAGAEPEAFSTALHFEIPDNDYAKGRPFKRENQRAFVGLAQHFLTAHEALERLLAQKNAGDLRIWPHHFDLGALITLDSEAGKSVGLGLSPGDGSYNEPYYYVSPWPYPQKSGVLSDEALAGKGFWHTEGFTAAVLKASDYTRVEQTAGYIDAFLDSALHACEDILIGRP